MTGTTTERVRSVLERVLQVRASALESSARLDEMAAVDSLSLAELAAALDEEFAIEVAGERLTTGLSVPQVVALVEEALRTAQEAAGR